MESRSAVISLSIHGLALALLLGIVVATAPVKQIPLTALLPSPLVKLTVPKGAAGGAAHDQAKPSFGHPPPRMQARVFVPPQVRVVNQNPALIMTVALDVPPSVATDAQQIGDPAGLGSMLSGGMNGKGGIGDGTGLSIGSGPANTVYRSGRGGVTAPIPVLKVEPEYSEEARKARVMGSVLVLVDVGPDGKVHNIRIARAFGMGLDEKAVEAVSKWLFRPGTKEGRPVTVAAQIEVAFRLL